jgi:hypothetical protein
MIEFLTTAIITASSAMLFAYWFRYTCKLILSARTTRDYAGAVVMANQLSFPALQAMLRDASPNLDQIQASLDRDYKLLSYLLKNSSNASTGDAALEKRMLDIDYRLMGVWYSVSRTFSPAIARRALDVMTMVVAHFANSMGERAIAGAAA